VLTYIPDFMDLATLNKSSVSGMIENRPSNGLAAPCRHRRRTSEAD
jgi:hypothetical protein